jgi:RimJ/RimL family protein N-acetyltransferase
MQERRLQLTPRSAGTCPTRGARGVGHACGVSFPETLETDRLVLRRLRAADSDAIAAIWSDADVWRALRPDSPLDPAFGLTRLDHHLRHWREHGFGLWIAQTSWDGEIAGWVGPAHPDRVPELAEAVEIGWTLRRPFWGRGLASEGAAAAVTAAFAHLEIDEVMSLIHRSNGRSLAVAGRLGMRHVRDLHHPQIGDLRVHAVTRAAWTARPESE